jgi:glycosyltransferase involved in cell wall biosynthesis/GR25 family glycosyltransferase involved in LPS biosynthesis
MIVRDEAHIVGEALRSVMPYLDTWVVVDTGSTDGTQDLIREVFAAQHVRGELFERPWRDFGTNRTEALQLCEGRADYAWVLDADDLFYGDVDLTALQADAYRLRIGAEFTYWRPQLFKLDKRWEYVGVVHEYVRCLDEPHTDERLLGDYFVASRRLGSRSRADDKYLRDAELLRAAIKDDPDDARSVFYLAQSLYDAGQLTGAVQQYKRRIELGGWSEETFFAKLQLARCLDRLGSGSNEVVGRYLDAAAERPTRAEPLYEIARHYRLAGRFDLAYRYACAADELPLPDDELFLATDVYEWKARDERAISAFYVGHRAESFDLSADLLVRGVPFEERERVEANLQFGLPAVLPERSRYPVAIVDDLVAAPVAASPSVTLTMTTCRRRALFEQTMNSFLRCCTDRALIDRWIVLDDGSTEDDLDAMRERYPFVEVIAKPRDERGHARSMNRLLELVDTPYWLHLEDDWMFLVPDRYVSRSIEVLASVPDLGQVLFNRNYAETLDDARIIGGERRRLPDGSPFRIHGHAVPGTDVHQAVLDALPPGGVTNVLWPHFSLRPSVMRTDVIRELAPFDEHDSSFEQTFGFRYTEAGYRSGLFEQIASIHLGPTTQEIKDAAGPANAYDLNGQEQFGRAPRDPTRVRLLTDWTDSKTFTELWNRQTRGDGRWDDLQLVTDGTADYTVVVNHPNPDEPELAAAIEPARTIVVQTDELTATAASDEWADLDRRRFAQVRSRDRYPRAIEWHLDWDLAAALTEPVPKTRLLSAVLPSGGDDEVHRLRTRFVQDLQDHGVPIDVFGRDDVDGFAHHLGALPDHDHRRGILPYRYTFAAEDRWATNDFSEKIVDAVLGESLCFYWGCPNLEEHLDPDVFIRLPLESPGEARRIVQRAMAHDEWSRRIEAIRAEKRRLVEELQVIPTLARTIRGHRYVEDDLDLTVINLERRSDRWRSFNERFAEVAGERLASRIERHQAVDGRELRRTPELEELFRDNDFNFRRGIAGSALSHLEVWREVAAAGRPRLVLEDDVLPAPDFGGQLVELAGQLLERGSFDLVLLGQYSWDEEIEASRRSPWLPARPEPFDADNYLGGCFGYVLSPMGAERLVGLVERDGIQQGIDWFVSGHRQELDLLVARPHLVRAELAVPGSPADSDIQHDQEPVT